MDTYEEFDRTTFRSVWEGIGERLRYEYKLDRAGLPDRFVDLLNEMNRRERMN